jgi:hypothetical protein
MTKKLLAIFLTTLILLSCIACNSEESQDDYDIPESKATETPIKEIVAMDYEEYSVKINSLGTDYSGDLTVGVFLENKSSEKSYTFSVDSTSINGITCSSTLFTEVTPGRKANETINFDDELLRKYEVGDYTDIEITFNVQETNTYGNPATKTIHVYPQGEEKAVKYTRNPKSTDKVIFDNEYVTAIIINHNKTDNYIAYEIDLFLVNKTNDVVVFESSGTSINGFMTSASSIDILNPGQCSFSTLYWTEDDLSKNDIDTIKEIEFILSARDTSSFSGKKFASETVKVTP